MAGVDPQGEARKDVQEEEAGKKAQKPQKKLSREQTIEKCLRFAGAAAPWGGCNAFRSVNITGGKGS